MICALSPDPNYFISVINMPTPLAIIETGGKQYFVRPGMRISVEKLEGSEGSEVIFDKVLLSGERNSIRLGTPYILGNTVTGKIVGQYRDDKKIVFRYHSKTRYRKMKGHRQPLTEIEIVEMRG